MACHISTVLPLPTIEPKYWRLCVRLFIKVWWESRPECFSEEVAIMLAELRESCFCNQLKLRKYFGQQSTRITFWKHLPGPFYFQTHDSLSLSGWVDFLCLSMAQHLLGSGFTLWTDTTPHIVSAMTSWVMFSQLFWSWLTDLSNFMANTMTIIGGRFTKLLASLIDGIFCV